MKTASRTRIPFTFLVVGALAFVSCAASPPAWGQEDPDHRRELNGDSLDADALFENLEIMRELLATDIETEVRTGKVTVQTTGETVDYRGPGSAKRGRAFYVPDMGAFFAFQTTAPLVPVDPEPNEKSRREEEDRWEEARRELRTGREGEIYSFLLSDSLVHSRPESYRISPEAVERIKKRIIETLGLHGGRIEQLHSRDHLTVSVTISGHLRYPQTGLLPGSTQSTLFSAVPAARVRPVRLTVQVRKEDADSYRNDGIDLDRLVRRARIHTF